MVHERIGFTVLDCVFFDEVLVRVEDFVH